MVSVATHGATGDGETDDRASILAAIAALSTTDRELFFPPGRYKVSKYVPISGVDGLLIRGQGATILYQSADTGISTDATATSDGMARSGLLAIDCDDLTIHDLGFEGSVAEVDITVNVGVGIYLRNCARARVDSVRNWYGGSLLSQENQTADLGIRVSGCHSYGARNPVNVGSDAVISGCRFEQPTDAGYDRVGSNGSTHGIYLFAGRRNVIIQNCHFKHIRTDAVKGSGTSVALANLVVQGCTFVECGTGVLWGADDVQGHDGLLVEGNVFEDCGTGAAGSAGDTASVVVFGSTGAVIRNNLIRYTRECLGTVAAVKGIQIQRYAAESTPCRAVFVEGNTIFAEGIAPGSIVTQAIYGNQVDGLVVANNMIRGVGGIALSLSNGCDRAVLRGNVIRDCVTAINVASSVGVAVLDNVLHRGGYTSSNPILLVDSATRPTIIQRGNVDVASDGKTSVLVA